MSVGEEIMEQKEFLDVLSINEARERLNSYLTLEPGVEKVELSNALGRIIAEDIIADVDVPPFDRAAMDGYALRASDTFYADEEKPVELRLAGYIPAGSRKSLDVEKGRCAGIATGAPIPKGANSVVMVEFTERIDRIVRIYRPVAPGENIMAAGADIMRGETALRKEMLISLREMGVLAALGIKNVNVYKKPKVAIFSTGDEIVEPGRKLAFGEIFDANANAIAGAVAENGGVPVFLGVLGDNVDEMFKAVKSAVDVDYDIVITSGGTSAGVGDLFYRVVDKLGKPGIIVHGIAVKPGKPTIIGVAKNKPIFGLPGYPTSAMIIFDVFVAPLLRKLSGLREEERKKVSANTAARLYSSKGRYEYMLVNLVRGADGSLSAYPVAKSSGAITALAEADGYIEIPENREMISENSAVDVMLLSDTIRPADLTIIGSHCIGVDILLGIMNQDFPVQAKTINVGSSGGLAAVRRGESDISGTHLIDEATGIYNLPFLERLKISGRVYLIRGYDREQGFVIAKRNPKKISGIEDILSGVSFINRNAGSGTRVLFDMELAKIAEKKGTTIKELSKKIRGYEIEAKSHSAIAAAVAYGRADVGMAIKTVAEQYDLGFIPLREEKYDFAIPKDKIDKPAVKRFIEVLGSVEFKNKLKDTPGLKTSDETGKIIHSPD